jgi:hypothetical protein
MRWLIESYLSGLLMMKSPPFMISSVLSLELSLPASPTTTVGVGCQQVKS